MASKKNQEQSALNKMMREEIALREKEKSLQNELVNMAKARYKISNDAKKTQQDLAKALAESKSTEESIQSIQEAKDKLLEEAISKGKEINSHYYDMLDTRQKLLEKLKEEEDIQEEILGFQKEAKDELLGSLGTLGEMLKAGTALGAAMALFKGLTEGIGEAFDNTIGFASDLNKELGISSTEAAGLGMQNLSVDAMFSRFSIEQLNQATKDLATTFGTTAGISNDLRNSVAELSAMGVGGDDAAKLSQMFETANGNAVDMTAEIKEMANDAGVMASTTFKDLASQQRLMLGATKEEIKLLAKKTIELNKQGLTLDTMKSISESMMDIEGTMKAQAKARTLLAGKLTKEQLAGMQGMTAAAMEFQQTGNFEALREQLKKAGMDAAQFNKLGPRGQQLYAESIGMTADQLAEQIQKQEQADKAANAGMMEKAGQGVLEIYQKIPGGIKEATSGLIAFIAQMSIMNMMQGKGTGLGNLIPGMGGKGGGGDIQTEVPGADDVAPQAQGSEGGLKSLAEGLKAMGDGKVFAGIGAVALAGPAFIVALPSIPFLLFMGKVKLKALEENFTGLSAGLQEMSKAAVGALVMMLVGPALALGLLAIPFLAFMSIPAIGPVIQANFTALASGLAAFGNPGTAVFVLIGIGLMAALGVAMIPFAFALSLLTPLLEAFGNIVIGVMGAIPPIIGAIAEGFVTMMSAINLESVGALFLLGPALMSAAAGMIVFGAAMLFGAPAILGLALIGGALALLAPNLETFGNVVVNVMGAIPAIIQSIADGFVTMFTAITPENVLGMMMLGPALLSASVGMLAFSVALAAGGLMSFFGGGIIDDIKELSVLGPNLQLAGDGLANVASNLSIITGSMEGLSGSVSAISSLGTALMGVSGALMSMAVSGLMAMPIIGALVGLAAIAPSLGGIGDMLSGGDSESSDSGDSDMIDYDRLASVLQSQPIVLTIDGKAVQRITSVQRRQGKNARSFS